MTKKKLIVLVSVILSAVLLLTAGFVVIGETVAKPNVIELRIKDDHPGLPGFDLELQAIVYYGEENNTDRITDEFYELSCDVPEVKFEGEKIIIPASFKDNTELEGFNIYVKHKTDEKVVDYYPLTLKKWEMTNSDEFEGDTLNPDMWSVTNSSSKEDVGSGKTWGWDNRAVSVKDGSLQIDVLQNDGTGVCDADFISGKVLSKYSQNEGLFLSSIKMPTKGGALNAFWLVPTSESWGKAWFGKVRSGTREGLLLGEPDIVEYSPNWKDSNGVPRCAVTDHFWTSDTLELQFSKQYQVWHSTEKLATDYVTFACAWTPVAFYYYVDGVLVKTVKNTESTDEEAKMYFTVLTGGYGDNETKAWAGSFTEADLPTMTFKVDYCRWYK